MNLYFKRLNAKGGIHHNTVKLIAADDRYEPYLTRKNMLSFAQDPNILAVLGNVGTPTATAAVPIANDSHMLLFGAFTGAKLLRKHPPDHFIMNYRASYIEEMTEMVDALLNAKIKPSEMAFFTQDDQFGDSGFRAAIQALMYHGYGKNILSQIPHGHYTRNQHNIKTGLQEILKKKRPIKAFLIVGAYKPISHFILEAKKHYPNAVYLTLSFVGSTALAKALCIHKKKCAKNLKNIIVTQVTPSFNCSRPIAKEYLKALKYYAPNAQPNFTSFEGFIVAKLFSEGLKKAGKHPTRENIIPALESLYTINIGLDTPLSFGAYEHQASHTVWPSMLTPRGHRMISWPHLHTLFRN